MVTIFNCYKLLKPIGVASFDFRDNRPEILLASCLAMLVFNVIKLYSELVLSTLWMNLVQRDALRSSRVVRPVAERRARMKFQAGLLQERAFGPSPGRWRDSAEGWQMWRIRTQQQSLCGEKLSWVKGSPSYPSYPG